MDSGNPSERSSGGQVTIDRVDMGTGWVCFQPGEQPPANEDLPRYLNHAICTWLQRNPEFSVRATLPIAENGYMVAVHIWFD